jgi:hypothetical protein
MHSNTINPGALRLETINTPYTFNQSYNNNYGLPRYEDIKGTSTTIQIKNESEPNVPLPVLANSFSNRN